MLREYQQRIIDSTIGTVRQGYKRPVIVAPTGGGKTHIATDIVSRAVNKRNKVLFLAPRRELIYQTLEKFIDHGIHAGMIMAGENQDHFADVQVASFDTLHSRAIRAKSITMPKADVVIVDECFVAGTLVDGKPIESIVVGDQLTTGKIVAIRKKKTSSVVKITLSNGKYFVSTKNHPIMTDSGWVGAGDLSCYSKVVATTVCDYEEESPKQKTKANGMQELRDFFRTCVEKDVLRRVLDRVQEEECPTRFAGLCADQIKGDEREQPNEKSRYQEESIYNIEGYGVEAACAQRQWTPANITRVFTGLRSWMGKRSRYPNKNTKRQWLPDLLQGGCWKQRVKDCYRSGWQFAFQFIKAATGRKETKIFGVHRVESVEVYEQGSGNGFEQMCPDGYVYNLEVEGSNVYFANGILVHNCHLSMSKGRLRILREYSDKIVIGLTATPARSDGTGLGEFYDSMVNVVTVKELTEQGYLVPVEYYAPSEYDLHGVKQTKSDYVVNSLAQAVDKPKLIGEIYDNWARIAPDKRTVIFCTNRAHSRHVTELFVSKGIRAEHVDGETDRVERADILHRVRTGETQVLCNVFVASYGLDIPPLECCVLARPTKNISLYLQTAGRVLRPSPNKDKAIVIDHTGAIKKHGFIDEPIPWSLDGDDIRERVRKEREETYEPKTIKCPSCKQMIKAARICPKCGFEAVPRSEAIPVHHAELRQVQKTKKKTYTSSEKAEWFAMLKQHGINKGYAPGWASNTFRDKFGVWPNSYRGASPVTPNSEVMNFIKHKQIAYSFRRR